MAKTEGDHDQKRACPVRHVISLFRENRGAAAIEYGLGLALVAVLSITAWGAAGSQASPPAVTATVATPPFPAA